MARAIVTQLQSLDAADLNLVMRWEVYFVGNDVINRQRRVVRVRPSMVQVTVLPTDTPAMIRAKVVDEVVALATAFGFTVARTSVLLPVFERGV